MKALTLLTALQKRRHLLPATDGHEISLRRITEPITEQKSLVQQLGPFRDELALSRRGLRTSPTTGATPRARGW
jgi:hypothetical protein